MNLLTKIIRPCQILLIRISLKSHQAAEARVPILNKVVQEAVKTSLKRAKSSVQNNFKGERERVVSLVAVLMLPFIFSSYHLFPSTEVQYYGDLQVLIYSLSMPVSGIFLGIAWFMWSKDSQILSTLGILFFTVHLCELIPFYNDNPLWFEVVSVVLIFGIIVGGLYFLKKKIRERRMYRLNHVEIKFPQRVQGLLNLIEIDLKKAFKGNEIDLRDVFDYMKHGRSTTQEEIDYITSKMK